MTAFNQQICQGPGQACRLNVPESRLSNPAWCKRRDSEGAGRLHQSHIVVRPPESSCQVFSLATPHPDFMAFAIPFSSPPSISVPLIWPLVSLSSLMLFQVTRLPRALIKIASFSLWLLCPSVFSFKAADGVVVVFFSQELQMKRETKCERLLRGKCCFFHGSDHSHSQQSYKTVQKILLFYQVLTSTVADQ